MAYHLADSLSALRGEVNALWPDRSKVSDGWIGDTSHQARKSDHNPDWDAPGNRNGVVRALDITVSGVDVDLLLKHTTNDSRVSYVIHNRRIYTHDRGWYKYNGSNPHVTHVHVSIAHSATAENDVKKWFGNLVPLAKPKPKKDWPHGYVPLTNTHTTASHNAYVKMLDGVGFSDSNLTMTIQKWLRWNGYYTESAGFIIDGVMGNYTVQELQKFLKSKGIYRGVIDGDRGPMTVKAEIAYINSQAKHYR